LNECTLNNEEKLIKSGFVPPNLVMVNRFRRLT
jgi:hypothetical protein